MNAVQNPARLMTAGEKHEAHAGSFNCRIYEQRHRSGGRSSVTRGFQKIQAVLQDWGCSGGKIEKEAEATGVFEVDDAKCHDGQYDIKLDKDFKMISITRD